MKTFGHWIIWKLNHIDRSQIWLKRKCDISGGGIHRWLTGSFPKVDKYLLICNTFAKQEKRPISDIINESLIYMPYLINNDQVKNCPTCGQQIRSHNESIKSLL